MRVILVILLVKWLSTFRVQSFQLLPRTAILRSTQVKAKASASSIGGKLVITGAELIAEDEFLLSLLNEQELWSTVTLTTNNMNEAQNRLKSRVTRSDGMLNVLEFTDMHDKTQLRDLLSNCSAWLAFNVSELHIAGYSTAAIDAGVKRAIFTLQLPRRYINQTNIPSFEAAKDAFRAAGGAFTGIRHGQVLPGSEYFAYQIVNATEPLVVDSVRSGVLARVVTEMLYGNATHHAVCGLSSAGHQAGAYLDLLRGAGLSRQEEVVNIFHGGVQKAQQRIETSRTTSAGIKPESRSNGDEENNMSKLNESDEERMDRLSEFLVPHLSLPPHMTVFDEYKDSEEEEDVYEAMDYAKQDAELVRRLERDILDHAFRNKDVSWQVTAEDFDEVNGEHARGIANTEVTSWRELRQRKKVRDIASRFASTETIVDVEKNNLAQLLSLQHNRATKSPRRMAEVWVRYAFLVLEHTTALCQREAVRFEALAPHEQTLLLRNQANELRAQCGLPASDVVCDPEHALVVVSMLSNGDSVISDSTAEIIAHMRTKYSNMLHSLPALENIATILKSSITTLRHKVVSNRALRQHRQQ